MSRSEPPAFGRLRSFLWPIHRHELKKVLPMLMMFFFISLVYSLLRNTKDALIVTAPGGGASLIPFVKVYGTIPGSVLLMLAYAKLAGRLRKAALFQVSIGFFLGFFVFFACIYPFREAIEPVALAARFQAHLPAGLGVLAALARHWVLALFYVMSELWGSVALSLLFWGFANDISRVEESKRYYALFGVGANLALIAVKPCNQAIRALAGPLAAGLGVPAWTAYLDLLVAAVVLSGYAILGLYRWMHAHVVHDPVLCGGLDPDLFRAPRKVVPLGDALRLLAGSRYLGCIALLVLCYGVAINLIEVTWKHQLGLRYPSAAAYQDYMANFSLATGCATIFLMLFVSSNVIRRFGWTVAALATPVVLLVSGAAFFGFLMFHDLMGGAVAGFGAAAVHLGAVQNVASKATKYSLFDPTKEMAYIPLDQQAKVRGKAAIDVVGARFGKAGGSVIQQVLIALYGSLGAITGPVAVLLGLVLGLWIWATVGLGRRFRRLTAPQDPPCRSMAVLPAPGDGQQVPR